MIQFEMPRQQRYQLVADDESDMPERAEEYTICNLRSGPDPGPYMFCGGEWVMLSSYAVRDGTLKIYHDVKAGDQPWDGDASEVKEVVVADSVKTIGAGAFASLENLEYVSIPAGVTVEDGAFSQTFKDPFDADIAMADVAGYEYVAYEGVMYQCDPEIFTYSSSNWVSGLTSEAASAKVIVLPNVHNSTNVVGISASAFASNATITLVLSIQGSHITSIYANVFNGCSSLSAAVLPDSMLTLSGNSFQGCTVLETVNLPPNLRTIAGATFNSCPSLQKVHFPATIDTLGSYAYNGCTGIMEVSFEKGFNPADFNAQSLRSWTFYAADGTTVLDKTDASALAGKTFKGSASRLVEDAGPVPGMEGRYMYAITTDDAGMNILSVQAAHDGRPLDTIVTASTRRQGAENIPDEWDFENGVGPFKCWYGAFNVQDYVAGTEGEEPVCTGAGMLAYRLDPYDLGTTMGGTELQGTYNVFLVVPTVYWKAVGNILYLSDDSSYAGVTGMTAYAHTATLPDTTQSVYPFIGIGVYEASSDGTKLLSVSGTTPVASLNYSTLASRADALASAGQSDFQMWDYYQWTLLKMMCYAVMGTKNSQWMMGDGVMSGVADTGQSDAAGPYAQSTSEYSKVFVENAWGSLWALVGDAVFVDYILHAGNTLGGETLGDQAVVSGNPTLPSDTTSAVWIQSAYLTSEAWDVPATASTTSTADDPSKCGDQTRSQSGTTAMVVGGRSGYGKGAGMACATGYNRITQTDANTGTRLSAFFDGTTMGTPEVTAKAAPAPTRSTDEDLPEAERDEPAEEPVAEEPVEESDEGTMDIEGL